MDTHPWIEQHADRAHRREQLHGQPTAATAARALRRERTEGVQGLTGSAAVCTAKVMGPRLAYSDSSDRLNDVSVRVRSDPAINAAAGFMRRIQPKSSPMAT